MASQSSDNAQWEFDAPKYWDFSKPDSVNALSDSWFANGQNVRVQAESSRSRESLHKTQQRKNVLARLTKDTISSLNRHNLNRARQIGASNQPANPPKRQSYISTSISSKYAAPKEKAKAPLHSDPTDTAHIKTPSRQSIVSESNHLSPARHTLTPTREQHTQSPRHRASGSNRRSTYSYSALDTPSPSAPKPFSDPQKQFAPVKTAEVDSVIARLDKIRQQLAHVAKNSGIKPIESQLTRNKWLDTPMDELAKKNGSLSPNFNSSSVDDRIRRARRVLEESKRKSQQWLQTHTLPETSASTFTPSVPVPTNLPSHSRLFDYSRRNDHLLEKSQGGIQKPSVRRISLLSTSSKSALLLGDDDEPLTIRQRIEKLHNAMQSTNNRRESKRFKSPYLPVALTVPKSPNFATDDRLKASR
ncbi:uncharacterized protein BYT42DRAFT_562825 [Radiomyces spectabilis]|uniref:uncharacterized protein n=1 Tax=Radiomyces spectabilis TaxID=64574 RepID=UPI00221EA51A|nr:uncharacterized protein BYT42DRAFT_562825 [Radiomyces spectabilis]KAI8384538.1 hypothetical protein BYT42DRAFT_562825 [Radiomyces spectabilis]